MNPTVLITIAITGFGIAFFHAAIPTHWLPFVVTAKAQRWSRNKTLAVTAIAGAGHVTFTALLGLIVAWLGIALTARIGGLFSWIAGAALFVVGVYYLYRQINGRGHVHSHLSPGHPHQHHEYCALPVTSTRPIPTSDRVAITGLVALLTFSPCEAFVPVYVSAVRYGWPGFTLLTVILSVATVAGMVLFTSLTLAGAQKLNFAFIEKYESGLTGALLCAVGILVVVFER
ncbi:MAG: hypothetical protein ACR2MF_01175 [Chthoniobacterales bacterium]